MQPLRSLLARVRRMDRYRADALLGVVVGVEMQVEAALGPAEGGLKVAIHAALLLLAACVALRRRLPVLTSLAALGVFVFAQGHDRAVTDSLYLPLFLVLFLNYSVAANAEGRRFWIAPFAAYAAGLAGIAIDDYGGSLGNDLLWLGLVFVAGPMVAGRLVRSRGGLQRALRAKAERLEREREERAAEAVVDERTRIAGELHDIVAHALSAMTVQASAAARLAERKPERAREAFAAVEDHGREALAELRRLLGVLRQDDEELALAPQPSLRHVEALVARARAAGLPVELDIEGEAPELPAGVDVTGYRVVQEALGGALSTRHAERARVRVRYGPEQVELEVDDDGRSLASDDDELLGLRERVAVYGGELHGAYRRDGGHVVKARLPVEVA